MILQRALWIFGFGVLVLGQTPAPPPKKLAEWYWTEPVSSIQGSYELKESSLLDVPPSLATLWDIGTKPFSVVAWPPKYCQGFLVKNGPDNITHKPMALKMRQGTGSASCWRTFGAHGILVLVHVYFIPTTMKGVNHFHVLDNNITESPYIKFYPHIGKLVLSTDGITKKDVASQRSSVVFQKSANHFIETTAKPVDKIPKWNNEKKEKHEFNLTSRMALLLTNSRFCFAHVQQSGDPTGRYTSLFNLNNYFNQSDLPMFLTTYTSPQGAPSLFKPPVPPNSTKTEDLLTVLQNPKFINVDDMRQKPHCFSYSSRTRNPLDRKIGKISADSWDVSQLSSSVQNYTNQFSMELGKHCSWVRLWFSNPGDTMENDYAKNMKLEDTIDFFFDQQFMIGPDSNEARPLSGDSTQIRRFTFRQHILGNPNQNPEKVMQVSYGRGRGPAMPFIDYFHLPKFYQRDFSVTMIKAANCEAVLIPGGSDGRAGAVARPRTNMMQMKNCKRSLLADKEDDGTVDNDPS